MKKMIDKPAPCHTAGTPMNYCAAALYHRRIYNRFELHGEWSGWKMAGKMLVAPNGSRISTQRLFGILFFEKERQRLLEKTQQTATSNVMPFHRNKT